MTRNIKPVSAENVELMEQMCRYIETHLEESLTLAVLARQVGTSVGHFQRLFKKVVGVSPREYTDAKRLEQLKRRLREDGTVTEAMYEAGYSSSSRLYERAGTQLGMTPRTYKRGGMQMTIRYNISQCVLGRLLLAGTERGICAVSIADKDSLLTKFLAEEFPAANLLEDPPTMAEWVEQVLQHLNGEKPHLDLPLDVRATAFQWKVWQELQKIPYGETRTYTEIAKQLGQPTAARAVARACATNPVAVVVPCHRVIREDGSLSGYRWGVDRKKKLLEQEQANRCSDESEATES